MPPDYIVTVTAASRVSSEDPVSESHLVRAKSQAQALAHVVAGSVHVALAGTDDIIRLAKAGVELEKAE